MTSWMIDSAPDAWQVEIAYRRERLLRAAAGTSAARGVDAALEPRRIPTVPSARPAGLG